MSEDPGRPKGISEEGSKGISVDLVRDPWVIFRGDLGDIVGVLGEDLVSGVWVRCERESWSIWL